MAASLQFAAEPVSVRPMRPGLVIPAIWLALVLPFAAAATAPLSSEDAQRYARIFEVQTRSDWRAADREIAGLDDRVLMGHVLYQRYMHPTGWRSTYAQLHDWMRAYADHPLAEKIHKLAQRRRPRSGWKALPKPRLPRLKASDTLLALAQPGEAVKRPKAKRTRREYTILRQVRRNVLRDRMTVTEKMLHAERRRMSPEAMAEARAFLARGHLSKFRFDRALKQARLAVAGAGGGKRLGAWMAGLTLWATDRQAEALEMFRIAADTPPDSVGNMGGAIDYWHARAALTHGAYEEALTALGRAARHPRTLHGQLARRQLQRFTPFDWSPAQDDTRILTELSADNPAMLRARALVQVGQFSRADAELKRLSRRAGREGGAILMIAAGALSAPSTAYRMARIRLNHYGEAHDAALYPAPDWPVADEDAIGRALVLAVARRESGYDPTARSHAGARGLMQLMPATASYVARNNGFDRRELRQLHDPSISLKYGQAYLGYLSRLVKPSGCLIHILAAYNAGPGNLAKWKKRFGDRQDPLLFIELMGARETRNFVRDVVAAYWVYRDRLGQPVDTLDLLTENRWPRLALTASDATANGEPAHAD